MRVLPCRTLPWLSILLLLTACGQAAEEPDPVKATPEVPEPAAPQEDAPERLFNSRLAFLGEWWPALRARVDPACAADPWPEEQLARLAEEVLSAGLEDWIEGREETLGTVIGPRTAFPSPLRPRSLTVVREDRALRMVQGQPQASGASAKEPLLGIAGARKRLGTLLEPYRACRHREVESWVTAVAPDGDGILATEVHLRIWGEREAGGFQANLQLQARWRVGGKRVVLASLETLQFEELETGGPVYLDRTAQVVKGVEDPRSWIWAGARECSERTDNLIVFTDVHLGMHGAAVGDVDGDGLEDLYVARPGGAPNLLLRHEALGTTRDVAAASQVDFLDDTSGVLIVDLDGDGARDLALGVGTEVVICWNDGSGVFAERTVLARLSQDKVYSLAAGDGDGDGDLDLYDTRYFSSNYGGGVPTPYHDAHNGGPNSYWRNEGKRAFVDATAQVGLDEGNDRFSLVSLWEDVDGDGDLDLYVVNDFGRNNLYRNDGGRFVDVAQATGLMDMAAGMGVTPSDVNGDGAMDLYVSNMYTAAGSRVTRNPRFQAGSPASVRAGYRGHTRGNSLLLGDGKGHFTDGSGASLASPGGWAWGAVHVDMDNDGRDEFVVPNGFLTGRDTRDLASFFWRCVVNVSPVNGQPTVDYQNAWAGITRLTQVRGYCWSGRERHYAYWGVGPGRFADASRLSGLAWEEDGRVAVRMDWDGDGLEDLWLKNRTAPVLRFMHNSLGGSADWVAFELQDGAPNTEAVGALVQVRAGGRTYSRRVYAGEGYLAGQSKRLHFGLGDLDPGEGVEWARVHWPDGSVSEATDLETRRLYIWDRREEAPRVFWTQGAMLPSSGPPPPVDTGSGRPWPCLVALERVPCSSLPLPHFGGDVQPVSSHAGSSLLIYLWATWDEASREGLAALAQAAPSLEESGLALHALSLNGPRGAAEAEAAARDAGALEWSGRADRRVLTLIELLLQSTLGAYDDLALPIGLLVDPDGRLVAVHLGPLDLDLLQDQARRLADPDPRDGGRWTYTLTGGRWLGTGPARIFDRAIKFLAEDRGEKDLAAELQAFVDAR